MQAPNFTILGNRKLENTPIFTILVNTYLTAYTRRAAARAARAHNLTHNDAGEGAEGGAGGARSAQDRQQGVAAPEAARRDRARAHLAEREA